MSRRRWVLFGVVLVGLAWAGVWMGWDHLPIHGLPTTGREPRPGDAPDWLARHQKYAASAQSGANEVVVVGDSLVLGWDDHRQLWANAVTDRPTEFFGIGGDATNQVLWRIADGELDGPPPRLVIVSVGVNNLWINADPTDLTASILDVVERVRRRQPTCRVIVSGLLPNGRSVGHRNRKRFDVVNRQLARGAHDEGIRFVDAADGLLEPDGEFSPVVSPDGVHLSAVGYRRWAAVLGPIVRAALSE